MRMHMMWYTGIWKSIFELWDIVNDVNLEGILQHVLQNASRFF